MKTLLTRPVVFPLWIVLIGSLTRLAGDIGWPFAILVYVASFGIGYLGAAAVSRRQRKTRCVE